MSSPNVVFVCKAGRMFFTVNKPLVPEWPTFTDVYSIYWLLQLVIPTILISHAAQRIASSPQQCRAHSNKHFKTVFLRFRTPVLLLKRSSSHSDTVILLIFVIVSENSTELTSFHCVVRFVVVVAVHLRRLTVPSFSLFPKIRRFWRHLTHRSLCFVFPVLLSSFTPATVSHFCRYWRH